MLKAAEDAGGSFAECKSVPTARDVPQHQVPFVPLPRCVREEYYQKIR